MNQNYENSNARKKLKKIYSKWSCTSSNCSIETLMKENKTVVAEKYDFENGDESI